MISLIYRTRPKRRINKYKFEIRFLKEISRSLNPLGSHSGAETMKIEISSSVILLECFKIQNSGKPIYDRMRKWNFWLYFWRPKESIPSKVMKGTLQKIKSYWSWLSFVSKFCQDIDRAAIFLVRQSYTLD